MGKPPCCLWNANHIIADSLGFVNTGMGGFGPFRQRFCPGKPQLPVEKFTLVCYTEPIKPKERSTMPRFRKHRSLVGILFVIALVEFAGLAVTLAAEGAQRGEIAQIGRAHV